MLNSRRHHSEQPLVDLLLLHLCIGFVRHPEEFPSGYKERGLGVPHLDHRPRRLVILVVYSLQRVPRLPLYPWDSIYVRGGLDPGLLGLFNIIQLRSLCILKVHMRRRGLRPVRVRVGRLIIAGQFRERVHVSLHHG